MMSMAPQMNEVDFESPDLSSNDLESDTTSQQPLRVKSPASTDNREKAKSKESSSSSRPQSRDRGKKGGSHHKRPSSVTRKNSGRSRKNKSPRPKSAKFCNRGEEKVVKFEHVDDVSETSEPPQLLEKTITAWESNSLADTNGSKQDGSFQSFAKSTTSSEDTITDHKSDEMQEDNLNLSHKSDELTGDSTKNHAHRKSKHRHKGRSKKNSGSVHAEEDVNVTPVDAKRSQDNKNSDDPSNAASSALKDIEAEDDLETDGKKVHFMMKGSSSKRQDGDASFAVASEAKERNSVRREREKDRDRAILRIREGTEIEAEKIEGEEKKEKRRRHRHRHRKSSRDTSHHSHNPHSEVDDTSKSEDIEHSRQPQQSENFCDTDQITDSTPSNEDVINATLQPEVVTLKSSEALAMENADGQTKDASRKEGEKREKRKKNYLIRKKSEDLDSPPINKDFETDQVESEKNKDYDFAWQQQELDSHKREKQIDNKPENEDVITITFLSEAHKTSTQDTDDKEKEVDNIESRRKHRSKSKKRKKSKQRADSSTNADTPPVETNSANLAIDATSGNEKHENVQKQHETAKKRKSWREISLSDVINLDRQGQYTWDLRHKGQNICIHSLTPNVLKREIAAQSTDAARGCRGYTIGYHEFKISFNDKPWGTHCTVGFCTKDTVMHYDDYRYLLGSDELSWGWDIPNCTLYHGGQAVGHFPKTIPLEDVPRSFSMILDLYNGIICFDFGHEHVEEAFTDIPPLSTELYPAVALVYGQAEVTINKLGCVSKQTPQSLTPQSPQSPPPIQGTEKSQNNDQAIGEQITDTVDRSTSPRPKLKDLGKTFLSYYKRKKEMEEVVIEEEAANVVYMRLEDMEDDEDQEALVEAHGWDFINRGGMLAPHPNCPRICVPQLASCNKVQGIRGKRGFGMNQGRHTWMIREMSFYSPIHSQQASKKESSPYTTDISHQTQGNAAIFGVASSEHRTFNYGFALTQMGDHAWGFEPGSMLVWHGTYYSSPVDMPDAYGVTSEGLPQEIDMREGVLVELDTHKHTLTYRYKGLVLCIIQGVRGDVLYPFLLFNQKACYPVEMCYIQGPQCYLEEVLGELRNLPRREKDEKVRNFRTLVKRSSSSMSAMQLAAVSVKSALHWQAHSSDAIIPLLHKNVISTHSSRPVCALAQWALSGRRHTLEFAVEGQARHLALGLVGPAFSSDLVTREYGDFDTVHAVGSNVNSWLWDIKNSRLYHADAMICKYPSKTGVDVTSHSKFSLTLDFTHLGYNTASFSAVPVNSSEAPIDLGIAFVNLPNSLRPAAVFSSISGASVSVKMEYISGAWMPERESQATQRQSAACVLL